MNKKIGLGILGALLLSFSGCEVIEGNLSGASNLTVIDTKGVAHELKDGSYKIKIKNKTMVFKDQYSGAKATIAIPQGFELPAANAGSVTLAGDRIGQNIDLVFNTRRVDTGSTPVLSYESCDCDRGGCFGRRDVTTTYNSSTFYYDIAFLAKDTKAPSGEFSAVEGSKSANRFVGPCYNVRPRPRCVPPSYYDGRIGRCVLPPAPPRPRPPVVVPAPRPVPAPTPACPRGTRWDARIQRCVR